MIRLTRSQPLPIGIDIGADSVKMLQLEVTDGDELSVVAAAREPMPEEVRTQPADLLVPAAIEVVRRMLHQHPFKGRRVVACLPRHVVQIKNLRLPQMPASELESAVRFEAQHVFDFDAQQAHVRHLIAGEVRQGTDVRQEVILLAARHDDVNAYLEQLHLAGCLVDSLDVEPCALYRTVERFIRRREDENDVHVLVDVGARRSQVLVARGRDISFFKSIEIGTERVVQAISERLSITPGEARALKRRIVESGERADGSAGSSAGAQRDPVGQAVFDATRGVLEELGREIALCLRYYSVTFRGQRPTKVRLVGGGACDPQLQAVLAAALTIPVDAARPLYSVDASKLKASDRVGPTSEWALAFGLALRTTKGPFGARDGRPREQGVRPSKPVEIVDLNEELRGATRDTAAAVGHAPGSAVVASSASGSGREPIHA